MACGGGREEGGMRMQWREWGERSGVWRREACVCSGGSGEGWRCAEEGGRRVGWERRMVRGEEIVPILVLLREEIALGAIMG